MRPAHQAREVTGGGGAGGGGNKCFNEARASSAGSKSQVAEAESREDLASMRPAHQAREVMGKCNVQATVQGASMRPAHQAREVSRPPAPAARGGRRFNEARASSAGSKTRPPAGWHRRTSFNEARASSAGSKRSEPKGASGSASFNEARASSAGSNYLTTSQAQAYLQLQ